MANKKPELWCSRITELRHKLVHCDHSTHVTDKDVGDARELLLKIATNCIGEAALVYPTHFVKY